MLGISAQTNTKRFLVQEAGDRVSSNVSEGGQVLHFHRVVIQWPTVNADDTEYFPF